MLCYFLTLKPIDLELQPIALLDGLMDLHVLFEFNTFSSSTQVIIDLISSKGLSFLKKYWPITLIFHSNAGFSLLESICSLTARTESRFLKPLTILTK